jgi:hypothetical protein
MFDYLRVEKPDALPVDGFETCFLHVPATVKNHHAGIVLANWDDDHSIEGLITHGLKICRFQFRGSNRAGHEVFPAQSLSTTDDRGFETMLIVYRDGSALVARSEMPPLHEASREDRFYVLPIVFKLSSVLRRKGHDELKIGVRSGSSRRNSDPIITVSNPKYPGSYSNLTYGGSLSGEGVSYQDHKDILAALLKEANAWAQKIPHLPALYLPYAQPKKQGLIDPNFLNRIQIDPEKEIPFVWPAAMPGRGWPAEKERPLKEFLGDLALWLMTQANGRYDHAHITAQSAQPRQTAGKQRLPTVKLILKKGPNPLSEQDCEKACAKIIAILKSDQSPIPLDNLIGHMITRGTRKKDHGYLTYRFYGSAGSAETLSNHEKLKLIQRFGTLDTVAS